MYRHYLLLNAYLLFFRRSARPDNIWTTKRSRAQKEAQNNSEADNKTTVTATATGASGTDSHNKGTVTALSSIKEKEKSPAKGLINRMDVDERGLNWQALDSPFDQVA